MELFLVALVNLVVGLLIGWSGIAGFLIPMFYAGYLGYLVPEALALSFAAFGASGVIGSISYYRTDDLPLRPAVLLSIGSFIGAMLGVWLNYLIPASTAKMILFVVVLVSGISILLRERKSKNDTESETSGKKAISDWWLIILGFLTGAMCALSGAGGPILVMPLLVLLGFRIRQAVGMSLFNSIFIAIPSFIGYWKIAGSSKLLPVLFVSLMGQIVGVLIGSKTSSKIKQRPLKISVAIFSIGISLYMILNLV